LFLLLQTVGGLRAPLERAGQAGPVQPGNERWSISSTMYGPSAGSVCVDVTTTENRPAARPAQRMGD